MEQEPAETRLPSVGSAVRHATPPWLISIEVLHYVTVILLLLWAFLFEHYRLAYEARVYSFFWIYASMTFGIVAVYGGMATHIFEDWVYHPKMDIKYDAQMLQQFYLWMGLHFCALAIGINGPHWTNISLVIFTLGTRFIENKIYHIVVSTLAYFLFIQALINLFGHGWILLCVPLDLSPIPLASRLIKTYDQIYHFYIQVLIGLSMCIKCGLTLMV